MATAFSLPSLPNNVQMTIEKVCPLWRPAPSLSEKDIGWQLLGKNKHETGRKKKHDMLTCMHCLWAAWGVRRGSLHFRAGEKRTVLPCLSLKVGWWLSFLPACSLLSSPPPPANLSPNRKNGANAGLLIRRRCLLAFIFLAQKMSGRQARHGDVPISLRKMRL